MKLPTTSFHLAALAALSLVNPALSATIILEASSARSQNGLYWSSSYFTGMESGIEWRSNFVFDLSTVSATVSSAYLEIDSYDYASSASTETITLFDSSVGFTLPPANVTTFGDLGSGTIYGSLTTSSADANSLLAVLLNPAALSDINSYLGSVFSIGITLSSIDGSLLGSNEGLFRNSSATGTQRLVLTTIPEPSSLVLTLLANGTLLLRRKRG